MSSIQTVLKFIFYVVIAFSTKQIPIAPYFIIIMAICDIATITLCLCAKHSTGIRPASTITLAFQYATYIVVRHTSNSTIAYCLVTLTMAIVAINTMRIIILSMHARNPKWLAGTNGRIGAPNWISLARMALANIIPHIYAAQPFDDYSNLVALVILTIAISTDALDGHIARSYNKITEIGKVLDPLCDKVIFYPTAIGIFIATNNTLLVPNFEIPAIRFVTYFLIAVILIRDAGFIIWFFVEGLGNSKTAASNIWDKVRFCAICTWLASMALALVSTETLFGNFLSWLSLYALILSSILSAITIAIALETRKQLHST